MSTIFWLVIAYIVGKRWLKKHPDAHAQLKRYLNDHVGTGRPSVTTRHPSSPLSAAKPKAPHPRDIADMSHGGHGRPTPPWYAAKKNAGLTMERQAQYEWHWYLIPIAMVLFGAAFYQMADALETSRDEEFIGVAITGLMALVVLWLGLPRRKAVAIGEAPWQHVAGQAQKKQENQFRQL